MSAVAVIVHGIIFLRFGVGVYKTETVIPEKICEMPEWSKEQVLDISLSHVYLLKLSRVLSLLASGRRGPDAYG